MTTEQILIDQAKKDGIQKITTGVVVRDGSKILLVRRNPNDFLGGMWEVPGGGIDSNESIAQGLTRELKEETNLELDSILQFLGTMDYLSGSGKKTRQFTYLVTVKDVKPIILTEHDAFKWIEIKDTNTFPSSDLLKTQLERITL